MLPGPSPLLPSGVRLETRSDEGTGSARPRCPSSASSRWHPHSLPQKAPLREVTGLAGPPRGAGGGAGVRWQPMEQTRSHPRAHAISSPHSSIPAPQHPRMLPTLPGSPGPQDVPLPHADISPHPERRGAPVEKRRPGASHAGRMRGDSAAGSQGSGHTNSPSTPRGGRASADRGLCGRTERGKGPPGTHRRLLHPAVWEPWQLHPQGCISGLVLPRALHALLRLPWGMEWSEWAEVGYFRAFPAILGSGYEALWAGQGRASVLLSQQGWMRDGDHEGRASHRTGSKERGGKPAWRIFTPRGSIPAAFTPNLQIYLCLWLRRAPGGSRCPWLPVGLGCFFC